MLHKLAFLYVTVVMAVLHNVAVAVFLFLAQNTNRVLAPEFFA